LGEYGCNHRSRRYYCLEDGNITLFFENCFLQVVIKKKIIAQAKFENECPNHHHHMRENRISMYNVRVTGKETGEPDVCRRSTMNCTELWFWEPKSEDETAGTEINSKLIFSQLLLSYKVLRMFTHGEVQFLLRKTSEWEIITTSKCGDNYI